MEMQARLAAVRERMAAACARAGRREDAVSLVAASKTVGVEPLRQAWAAGVRRFGENRVQERLGKQAGMADLAAEWRLIGPLQANKAAKALGAFAAFDALDSLPLAERLDRLAREQGRRWEVLVEVNLGREAQKHGVWPEQAPALLAAVGGLGGLRLRGLMTVPPREPEDAARRHFAALAELAARCQPGGERWELSMGMSHDFEIAIEEGATMVRLGSALFGERARRG